MKRAPKKVAGCGRGRDAHKPFCHSPAIDIENGEMERIGNQEEHDRLRDLVRIDGNVPWS